MSYAYLFIFIILVHEMFIIYEPYGNDDDDTNTTTHMFDRFVQVNYFEQNSILA